MDSEDALKQCVDQRKKFSMSIPLPWHRKTANAEPVKVLLEPIHVQRAAPKKVSKLRVARNTGTDS